MLMPWLSFGLAAIFFWFLGRTLKLPKQTTGALTVAGGLGNTSFIGLPMIEAFYNGSWTSTGIMISQLGTYLVLGTVGIVVICRYSDASASRLDIAKRIATFPPLIAVLTAGALVGMEYPVWADNLLIRLGDTLTPLALVSVGLQLRAGLLRGNAIVAAIGLGYKLVLAPVLIALVYVVGLHLRGEMTQVVLFEAAMPPQIGSAIVAMQYGLNAELITLMIGIGTVLCFLTLPVVFYLFRAV